jgi:hypothetical protein
MISANDVGGREVKRLVVSPLPTLCLSSREIAEWLEGYELYLTLPLLIWVVPGCLPEGIKMAFDYMVISKFTKPVSNWSQIPDDISSN